jgi:ABC-2 type transport system permease protein
MQYRFSFVVTFLINALLSASDLMVVLTVVYHFRVVGGWGIFEIGTLYGVTAISLAVYRAVFCEIHEFQDYIINGEFDSLLLRPWPTLMVLASRKLELHRLGGALQGLIVMTISLRYLATTKVLGFWTCLYIYLLPVTGTAIFFAIDVSIASLAFWIGRTRDVQVFAFYAPATAGSYPLSVYPGWLRTVLTILPVGFIGYVPLLSALGLGAPRWYLALPVLVDVVAVGVALTMWHAGERAYYSTGS